MNKDVLTNEKYASKVDNNAKNSLNTLSKFTDINTIQKKMTSKEMALTFGMPESTMKDLYTYYINVNEIDTKMTISEFSNFVLTDVLSNPDYASNFDETTINNIKMLSTFSDINTINKSMNSTELANLFGIEEQAIKQLLLLKYMNTDNGTKDTMTPNEFVTFILNDVVTNPECSSNFDSETKLNLDTINGIMNASLNNIQYTKNEIFAILSNLANNIDKDQVDLLYVYYGSSKEYNNNFKSSNK